MLQCQLINAIEKLKKEKVISTSTTTIDLLREISAKSARHRRNTRPRHVAAQTCDRNYYECELLFSNRTNNQYLSHSFSIKQAKPVNVLHFFYRRDIRKIIDIFLPIRWIHHQHLQHKVKNQNWYTNTVIILRRVRKVAKCDPSHQYSA